MPAKKIDGIIEAVRYSADGNVEVVRLFARRGTVWSDNFLMERAELVHRIQKGAKFFTGTRTVFLGSQFGSLEPVNYSRDRLSSGSGQSANDLLQGVPVF